MALWNNNLLIGVPEIDEQHKKLVQALEELSDACFKGQGKDKIEKTLNFVADYTKKHFSDEERLHAKDSYPQAVAHKEMHKNFIKSLTEIQNEFKKEGATTNLSIRFNKTLSSWLIRHITAEDKKYAMYLKSKSLG